MRAGINVKMENNCSSKPQPGRGHGFYCRVSAALIARAALSLSACFLFLASASFAAETELPNELGTFISGSPTIHARVFGNRQTPDPVSVTIDPEQPVAGEQAAITVVMSKPTSENERVTKVEIQYGQITETECEYLFINNELSESESEDTGKCEDIVWKSFPLESADSVTWKSRFPAFDKGTRVIYSIRAENAGGNMFVTQPCDGSASGGNRSFVPFFFRRYIEEDCIHDSSDASACNATQPRDCMVKIASANDVIFATEPVIIKKKKHYTDINQQLGDIITELHKEKPPEVIKPLNDLSIAEMRAGYDSEYFYLDVAVKGLIASGYTIPTNIYGYIAIIIDPVTDKGDNESLTKSIGTLFYSKLIQLMAISACHFGHNKGIDYEINDKDITCSIDENHIMYALKRSSFGSGGLNEIKVLMSAVSLIELYKWDVYTSTPFTTIRMSPESSFTVK